MFIKKGINEERAKCTVTDKNILGYSKETDYSPLFASNTGIKTLPRYLVKRFAVSKSFPVI